MKEIHRARMIMVFRKHLYSKRIAYVAELRRTIPNAVLHAGPQLRYKDSCGSFIALRVKMWYFKRHRQLLFQSRISRSLSMLETLLPLTLIANRTIENATSYYCVTI